MDACGTFRRGVDDGEPVAPQRQTAHRRGIAGRRHHTANALAANSGDNRGRNGGVCDGHWSYVRIPQGVEVTGDVLLHHVCPRYGGDRERARGRAPTCGSQLSQHDSADQPLEGTVLHEPQRALLLSSGHAPDLPARVLSEDAAEPGGQGRVGVDAAEGDHAELGVRVLGATSWGVPKDLVAVDQEVAGDVSEPPFLCWFAGMEPVASAGLRGLRTTREERCGDASVAGASSVCDTQPVLREDRFAAVGSQRTQVAHLARRDVVLCSVCDRHWCRNASTGVALSVGDGTRVCGVVLGAYLHTRPVGAVHVPGVSVCICDAPAAVTVVA